MHEDKSDADTTSNRMKFSMPKKRDAAILIHGMSHMPFTYHCLNLIRCQLHMYTPIASLCFLSDRNKQPTPNADPPGGWWVTFAKSMAHSRWTIPVWNRTCSTCSADLLQGKDASFCCNNRKWLAPALPPLPELLLSILQAGPASRHLSARSRALNNLFAFTVISTTQHFHHFERGPASVAIIGCTYH